MMGISAQVSLYPLRSAHMSQVIEQALRVFRAHGLAVRSGGAAWRPEMMKPSSPVWKMCLCKQRNKEMW